MIWTMKISYQHQTTLKKIKTMTELFEATLKLRNIEFTKSLENEGISEYKILNNFLEGIIWLSDSDKTTKFFINIPYANFQIYSSHWVKVNRDPLSPFANLLDDFVHQLETHSNRFNNYLEVKPLPAPISPQPFSPSNPPETIFKEKGFERIEDNFYKMSNDYLVAYISIDFSGKKISCMMQAKPKLKLIYEPYWRPTDTETLDKILDDFMRQIESYTKSLSLIKEKLIEIKENFANIRKICDNNLIDYHCLDINLNKLAND
jgi:hypothetical protein